LAYYDLKNYEKSLEDNTKSIELDPSSSKPYYNRALCKFELKLYKEALSDFNSAFELGLKDDKMYCWRGANYYEMRNNSAALEDLNKAIAINPEYESAWYYRALTKYDMLDDKGCLEDCKKAVGLKKSADTYYMIGVSSFNLKDYKAALDGFNESLDIDSTYKLSLLERGITQFTLSNDDAAQADLNKYIMMDPKSHRAYYYRGRSKKFKGDVAGSCADLKMALALGEAKAAEEIKMNGCKN
ncbi:MAG: tetratricopeptide repeat protein, partial [Bacteroidia bacterium]